MIQYERTNSDNNDFKLLVVQLDELLRILDGEEHAFYAALNTTDRISEVLIAYDNGIAVGCGALRPYEEGTVEVKRMFVTEACRGRGIASKLLQQLEQWARELNYSRCILETGKRQTAAVQLYHKSGYQVIESYGKYKHAENSICFEKML